MDWHAQLFLRRSPRWLRALVVQVVERAVECLAAGWVGIEIWWPARAYGWNSLLLLWPFLCWGEPLLLHQC